MRSHDHGVPPEPSRGPDHGIRWPHVQLGSRTPGGTARRQGFELDGDALLEELTDELLYHGDVNAALRRMMHQGLRDRNGDRLQGVRELLEKLRQERQDRLDRFDLGGVYDEIARELNDIVDEERHAIENAVREAEQQSQRSGDERRAENARESAMDRNMRSTSCPRTSPARSASCSSTTSSRRRRRAASRS